MVGEATEDKENPNTGAERAGIGAVIALAILTGIATVLKLKKK